MMFRMKILTLFALLCANIPSSKSQSQQPWATTDFNLIKFYTLQSSAKLSDLCRKQSDIYYNSLVHKLEMWSYKMIDASSKIQSGFFSANFANMGHFDQCLAVDYKVESIRGKFCYTKIKIPLSTQHEFWDTDIRNIQPEIYNAVQPFRAPTEIITSDSIILRWSICVPSGCTAEDVKAHLNSYFKLPSNPILPALSVFDVKENDCHSLETTSKLDGGDWTVIGIFIALGCFVLCSTIYDVFLHYAQKEPINKILIAFSWYSNFKSLIKINKNSDQLPCLNGIRFLSILWIIHGHELLLFMYQELVNQVDVQHWFQQEPWAWFTIGSTVSVDTFFVLSGCLLMYRFLKSQAKNIPFNVPLMYFHRYLRLTPAYLAVILIYLTLLTDMGSGPIWHDTVNSLHTTCQKYWWSGILYIQNYIDANNCVTQSWYLSVDMQLFVVSPIILLSVKYWPKCVPYLFSTLIVIFTIIPTIIAWQYNLRLIMGGGNFEVYYTQTHARAGPWILGLFLGYILYNTKNKQIRINRILVATIWLLTAVVMLFIVFGNFKSLRNDYVRHEAYEAIFIGLHRNVWGLAICWIIFACLHGYGGPVNWFLSQSMFQVLARLTYSIYLLHYAIQSIRNGNVRINGYFSNMAVLFSFFGTTCITLLLAVIWVLTFEYPFAVIANFIISTVGELKNRCIKNK